MKASSLIVMIKVGCQWLSPLKAWKNQLTDPTSTLGCGRLDRHGICVWMLGATMLPNGLQLPACQHYCSC